MLPDVFSQLGVRGADLPADPALPHQLLRPPAGHLVAVAGGDVSQEGFLGQTNKQPALPWTELAAEDLQRVGMFRDSDQLVDHLLVRHMDAVLPGHVLHHVLELLKAPVTSPLRVPGVADIAVEQLVRVDLSPRDQSY